MPVPGPRTQAGPDPGYRNPEDREPNFFNLWLRPGPVLWPGRTPGLMAITLRGCILAAGQIRRLWRQSIDYIPAQGAYSWTDNSTTTAQNPRGFQVTRALRYMTRSLYEGQGIDHTRFDAMHTVIIKQNRYKTVTVNTGQRRNPPTVRNRLTSFGSRVPTLNQQVAAAEGQQVGKATQA